MRCLLPYLFVLPAVAACIETGLTPAFPTVDDRMCDPQTELSCAALEPGDRMGASVALPIFGTDFFYENTHTVLAMGAPGPGTDIPEGYVVLHLLDRATGQAGTRPGDKVLPPAGIPASGVRDMGRALLAADVDECRTYGSGHAACGQELLIGAPGDASSLVPGAVLIYESQDQYDAWLVQYADHVTAPSPADDDEFGASLAAPAVALVSEVPWNPSPARPPWVAIGAPGADEVHLFEVDPTAHPPLVWRQKIVSPLPAGHRFGHALAAGDFDGDGTFDLAVSAPEPVGGGRDDGRVLVYHGDPTGTLLVDETCPLALDAMSLQHPGSQSNSYGWSLAAGDFASSTPGDDLLAGAPHYDDGRGEVGAVCSTTFTGSTCPTDPTVQGLLLGRHDCEPNNLGGPGAGEHYGYQVSVLNAESVDRDNYEYSPEALRPEVAISAPGFNGDTGRVVMLRPGTDTVEWRDAISLIEPLLPTGGERFGEAMASGYVSASPWEDLAVGAPMAAVGDGAGEVTRANDLLDCGGAMHPVGQYTIDDHNGDPRSVTIWVDDDANQTHLRFNEDFAVKATEGTSVCTITNDDDELVDLNLTLLDGVELVLGGWSCGNFTNTWEGVSMGPILEAALKEADLWEEEDRDTVYEVAMDVSLTMTTGSPDTVEIELDVTELLDALPGKLGIDEDCVIAPFSGVRNSEQACDL